MAKVKWKAGTRELAGVGLVETGDVIDVADDVAEGLIASGRAVAVGHAVPEEAAPPAAWETGSGSADENDEE